MQTHACQTCFGDQLANWGLNIELGQPRICASQSLLNPKLTSCSKPWGALFGFARGVCTGTVHRVAA